VGCWISLGVRKAGAVKSRMVGRRCTLVAEEI